MKDKYSYLKNKEKAIEYFEKENKKCKSFFEKRKNVLDSLVKDVKSRFCDYVSLPVKKSGYEYYYKTYKDKNYAVIFRKKDGVEEVLLDENKLAGSSKSLVVAYVKVSEDHNFLAFAFNKDGTDTFTLNIIDLKENKIIREVEDVASSFEWFKDNSFLFTRQDKSLRPYIVFRSYLDSKNEDELFEEPNQKAFVHLTKSKDKQNIFVNSSTKETNKIHIFKGKNNLDLFLKRSEGHEFDVESHKDSFYVLSNKDNKNFDLFKVKNDKWQKVLSPNKGSFEDFVVFEDYIVLSEVYEFERLRVLDLKKGVDYYIEIPDDIYDLENFDSPDFKTNKVNISYSTLISPSKHFEFCFETKNMKLLREDSLPGFNSKNYDQKRIYVKNVPVSICYNKKFKESENVWLAGYGSYGSSYPIGFRSSRVTLLDEGFIFAIAHVRGGGELGDSWYKDGKFLKKKNTFKDFEVVSKYFKDKDKNIVICGRSAGGMLVGVSINENPSFYKGCIASVPFVDVLNTMLDSTLPLTSAEFEEWGDPSDPIFYDYIKSYSPYDNVKRQGYPNIYITTSINDTRVQYFEPAKWHSKLKDYKTDNNLLLLEANMEGGHFGFTSKDDGVLEVCKEFVFAIECVKK
ncbi:MAG: prolyl oligopeptidase family serine peptidase [Candidatus Woesearchaeota archaeon]